MEPLRLYGPQLWKVQGFTSLGFYGPQLWKVERFTHHESFALGKTQKNAVIVVVVARRASLNSTRTFYVPVDPDKKRMFIPSVAVPGGLT